VRRTQDASPASDAPHHAGRSRSSPPSLRRRLALGTSVWIGIAIVATVALASLAAPLLPIADPYATNYGALLQAPSLKHPLGTDELGRDMFARVIYGGRIDLLFAFAATYVSLAIGMAAGAFAGHYRGVRETLVTRLADTMIAFPGIVLILAIVAIVGPGLVGVFIGVVLVSWALYARLTYSAMLVLRERQFILAAQTLGFSAPRVIFRHAIPNLLRPNLVFSISDMVLGILALGALSFLGVGVRPPSPEWGALIAGGQGYLLTAWWLTTLPGLVVVLVGVGFSLIGDGFSDRLNPGKAAAR
jgi:peptide/nickel transport system permease protein